MNPNIYFDLGGLYFKFYKYLQNYDLSKIYYKKSIELGYFEADKAFLNIGNICIEQSDLTGQIEAYKAASQLGNETARFWLWYRGYE